MSNRVALDASTAGAAPLASRRDFWIGVTAALTAAVTSGAWVVITRLGVTTTLSPFDTAFLRYAIPTAILLPVLLREGLALRRIGVGKMALMVAGAGLPFSLMGAAGMQLAPAAHAGAMLPGGVPLFVTALAVLFEHERLRGWRALGFAFIVIGVIANRRLQPVPRRRAAVGDLHAGLPPRRHRRLAWHGADQLLFDCDSDPDLRAGRLAIAGDPLAGADPADRLPGRDRRRPRRLCLRRRRPPPWLRARGGLHRADTRRRSTRSHSRVGGMARCGDDGRDRLRQPRRRPRERRDWSAPRCVEAGFNSFGSCLTTLTLPSPASGRGSRRSAGPRPFSCLREKAEDEGRAERPILTASGSRTSGRRGTTRR
jgi:hypothetical protein